MTSRASSASLSAAQGRAGAVRRAWCVWEAMVMCMGMSITPSLPREKDGRAQRHDGSAP